MSATAVFVLVLADACRSSVLWKVSGRCCPASRSAQSLFLTHLHFCLTTRADELTREGFTRAAVLLVNAVSKPAPNTSLPYFVDVLFDLFDTNNDGVVDYNELASGISLFCVGTTDEKVKETFEVYGEWE